MAGRFVFCCLGGGSLTLDLETRDLESVFAFRGPLLDDFVDLEPLDDPFDEPGLGAMIVCDGG